MSLRMIPVKNLKEIFKGKSQLDHQIRNDSSWGTGKPRKTIKKKKNSFMPRLLITSRFL